MCPVGVGTVAAADRGQVPTSSSAGMCWLPSCGLSTIARMLTVLCVKRCTVFGRSWVRERLSREGKTEVAVNRSVVWCDACAFMDALERDDLEGAVSKYGGAFLHGLHTAEAPEFVRWMETSRDRLARLYAIGIERLADEETQRGDMLAAAERWRRLSEMDPYNSRIVIRAMEALDAAGARCEALRLAERHEELVAQTFGADLEPIVKALAERLRKPTGGTHLAS